NDGTLLFSRNHTFNSPHYTNMAINNTDGSIHIVGYDLFSSQNYAIITKVDSSGTTLWRYRFEGNGNDDRYNSVSVDGFGNIYAVGRTNRSDFGVTGTDILISKYNSDGSIIWSKKFGALSGM